MLEVVIILYIYIHCSERGSLHGGFSYHMYTPIVLPTCTYTMYMYMCVSIEAADVCLQCTRTMCNIECCRFTTVKESSVYYTYIIQEEALVKGFYLCQHSLIPRDHTHLCGKSLSAQVGVVSGYETIVNTLTCTLTTPSADPS